MNKQCIKLNTCYKIDIVLDKDLARYAEAIKKVCAKCTEKQTKLNFAMPDNIFARSSTMYRQGFTDCRQSVIKLLSNEAYPETMTVLSYREWLLAQLQKEEQIATLAYGTIIAEKK